MSHKATNWAIAQRGLKPATKIVLWHLCDRHNPDLGCFPSQQRLAEDCEMARSTVREHLDKLEAAGLIRRENRQDEHTKRRQSTRYVFAFEADFGGNSGAETGADDGESHGRKSAMETEKAMAGKRQKPWPENAESHGRIPARNPVREPLTEPARARGGDGPDGASPPDDGDGEPQGAGGEGGSCADAPDRRTGQGHGSAGRAKADGDAPVPEPLRWRVRDLVIRWVLVGDVARDDAIRLVYGVLGKDDQRVPGLPAFAGWRLPPNDLNRIESEAFVLRIPLTVRREVVGGVDWVLRWIAGNDPKEPAKPFKAIEESFRRLPEAPQRDERIEMLRASAGRESNQLTEESEAA